MNGIDEAQLMGRAARLYHQSGLDQETSARLGLMRAHVNRPLQQARASGKVLLSRESVTRPLELATRLDG